MIKQYLIQIECMIIAKNGTRKNKNSYRNKSIFFSNIRKYIYFLLFGHIVLKEGEWGIFLLLFFQARDFIRDLKILTDKQTDKQACSALLCLDTYIYYICICRYKPGLEKSW